MVSNLLDLFTEIHYWDRLKYEIPPSVHDIYQRREELRDLREGALLLIRNYNRCEKPSDTLKPTYFQSHQAERGRVRHLCVSQGHWDAVS